MRVEEKNESSENAYKWSKKEVGDMGLIIPDEILQAARMTPEELKQEIAIFLFHKGKLTLGQASRLAGMSRLRFQHLLASREIPLHYDIADFEEDLKTLRELGRL